MRRAAIVVQRYGERIAGGSEAEARAYAKLLSRSCNVEVLTTTALDTVTWKNELPAGVHVEEGITVRRFPVDGERSRYWEALYDILLRSQARGLPTPFSFEEEWIRRQGPHSSGLLAYLERHEADYSLFLYFTYLYSPTYFGMQITPPGRNILVPTLHEEPSAQMECFRLLPRHCRALLFNTRAEQALAKRLWGDLPGEIVAGFPVEVENTPAAPAGDYVLYAGRIEPGKGCDELLECFARKHAEIAGVKLILIGRNDMSLPRAEWLDFRGFVSEQEKRKLLSSSICFIMPSRHESFSIVTLEAMAAGVPVIAADSPVLRDHIERSGCGRLYTTEAELIAAIADYRGNPSLREQEGRKGREYVRANYSPERIRSLLMQTIESAADGSPPGQEFSR